MSTALWIRGATIVSGDAGIGIRRGDILVRAGRIAAVGDVAPADASGADVIEAAGMIASPGFVDTHRHTWQSCVRHRNADHSGPAYFRELLDTIGPTFDPEDVYVGTLLGALSALDGGVTTLFDWAHVQNTPAHADAGIRALKESGIRAVFGHGRSLAGPEHRDEQRRVGHSRDLRRIQSEHFSDPSLVSLAMAARGPESTEDDVWRDDLAFARELGLRSSIHVAIGGLGPVHRAVQRMHDAGELGEDLIFIHANSCSDEEVRHIAESGAKVSIGVQVEMTSVGSGPIPTDRFLAVGVWPSLSGDSETMGTGDMLTQMRMVLGEYRLKVGSGHAAIGAPDTVSTADVHRMATMVGAEALGLESVTGSLTPGKAADIVLIDANAVNLAPMNDPLGAMVLAAHPGNVHTVIVDGRVRKRAGELVGIDLPRLIARAERSNRRHPAVRH